MATYRKGTFTPKKWTKILRELNKKDNDDYLKKFAHTVCANYGGYSNDLKNKITKFYDPTCVSGAIEVVWHHDLSRNRASGGKTHYDWVKYYANDHSDEIWLGLLNFKTFILGTLKLVNGKVKIVDVTNNATVGVELDNFMVMRSKALIYDAEKAIYEEKPKSSGEIARDEALAQAAESLAARQHNPDDKVNALAMSMESFATAIHTGQSTSEIKLEADEIVVLDHNADVVMKNDKWIATNAKIKEKGMGLEKSREVVPNRRHVKARLIDNDKGLDVQHALVFESKPIMTEDDDASVIHEVMMNYDIKEKLKDHNEKRGEQVDLDILDRTGNEAFLRPVKLNQLTWEVVPA